MTDQAVLAERFDVHRSHLRAVAYRMLGSPSEAEDAVQESWLRFSRADPSDVENLASWLTTVVARICLDMLRARRSRREELRGLPPEPTASMPPAPRIGNPGPLEPEHETVMVESVGRAMLVVLDTLRPDERVAFVLHDLFSVPFDDIAPLLDRSTGATKMLASRARHRVRGVSIRPAADLAQHRQVVDAFLDAARGGDIQGLLALLAPDVVRLADSVVLPAGVSAELRGAAAVAKETAGNRRRARFAQPALVDGRVGAVVAPRGQLWLVLGLKVVDGKVTEIDIIADPKRLAQLDLAVLDA